MSEDKSGIYSCSASLPNGRRTFVQTKVRIRPDIILSQGVPVTANEGEDVYLECLLVRGVQAKRMWEFNGEYEYGDRTKYENQGGLLIIQKAIPSDSGNYSCLATKKSSTERDSIEYQLKVIPSREHWTPGETHVSCSNVRDKPVEDLNAFKIGNESVGIMWTLPEHYNQSCYEHISLTWWTNATDSSYSDMQLPLDQTQVKLSGLESELTYYVQVNLVAPLNVLAYGHTLKFSLRNLKEGSFPEDDKGDNFDQVMDPLTNPLENPLVIVIISVSLVVLCVVLVWIVIKYRQKQSNKPFARSSVHIRHPSAISVCCQCRDWCYGPKETQDDQMFQKTNFNGFDTGMYDQAIITTTAEGPVSRPVSRPVPAPKRSSYIEKSSSPKKSDFMSNLTPQWPEPEEEAGAGQQEYDPFIRHHHPSTFDPKQVHMRRHGSKESISSSWSSLFNVPGTSSGTVSIRPNSVAVSNLSSSGSAADYAPKVAFIGNKYRKNK